MILLGGRAVPQPIASPITRSTFVTVVAWIFIGLSGMVTLISILQNILFATVFSDARMQEAMAAAPKQGMPPFFHLMFDHMRLFLLVLLIMSATKLVSAIGLLRRMNWARLLFIGLLGLDIAWSIGGAVLQQVFMSSMLDFAKNVPNAPSGFEDGMKGMMIAMRVFSTLFALGFGLLYAWIIKRLVSQPIVAEFT